jgi:hypothetical protein
MHFSRKAGRDVDKLRCVDWLARTGYGSPPVECPAASGPALTKIRSPYRRAISSDAGAPDGRHYYERASSFNYLSDEVIDLVAEYGTARTSPYSKVLIQHVHGAASRVSPTATAFALRDVPYVMNMVAEWNASEAYDAERHMEWVRTFQAAIQPLTATGVYVNFLGDEGEEQVRASYGINYERLIALKNRYDPTNFFRFNQNIRPTA